MTYVHIRYSDGEYSVTEIDQNEYRQYYDMGGCKVASIEKDVYEAWGAHVQQHKAWNDYWFMHDNAACRRAEKRDHIWVVFQVPGIGEVRQGPFDRDERGKAVEARNEARLRFDSQAYYLNDLGETPQSL